MRDICARARHAREQPSLFTAHFSLAPCELRHTTPARAGMATRALATMSIASMTGAGGDRPHRVFVYGTLKRGFYNHRLLEEKSASFVGTARTRDPMRLVLGEYGIPYLMPEGEASGPVFGELWRVDDDALDALDVLEGVDEGMYVRVRLQLVLDASPGEPEPADADAFGGRRRRASPSRAAWETRRASPYPRTIWRRTRRRTCPSRAEPPVRWVPRAPGAMTRPLPALGGFLGRTPHLGDTRTGRAGMIRRVAEVVARAVVVTVRTRIRSDVFQTFARI